MTESIDISDWVLAQANGLLVVGLQVEDGTTLSPVFQVHPVTMNQNGQLSIGQQVLPVWNFPSIDRMTLPAGASIMPVSALSGGDQKQLAGAVSGCVELIANLRRSQATGPSRLVLPGPDMKAMSAMRRS